MAANSREQARLQAFVSGVVQGVGYRYFAMNAAHMLGVTGWVRNRIDGSVMVVAEGPREELEKLLKELRRGPHSGRVDKVNVSWFPYQGDFDRFEVRF